MKKILLINLLAENLMIKSHDKKKRQKGFTLIELMIVIVIIGILATVTSVVYNAYRERSYIELCVSDSKNAFTAAQDYFLFQCDQ